jgi:hypothetical protein
MDLDAIEKNKEPEGFAEICYLLYALQSDLHVAINFSVEYMKSKYPKFFENINGYPDFLDKVQDKSTQDFLKHISHSFIVMTDARMVSKIKEDLLKEDLKTYRKYQGTSKEQSLPGESYDVLYDKPSKKLELLETVRYVNNPMDPIETIVTTEASESYKIVGNNDGTLAIKIPSSSSVFYIDKECNIVERQDLSILLEGLKTTLHD